MKQVKSRISSSRESHFRTTGCRRRMVSHNLTCSPTCEHTPALTPAIFNMQTDCFIITKVRPYTVIRYVCYRMLFSDNVLYERFAYTLFCCTFISIITWRK